MSSRHLPAPTTNVRCWVLLGPRVMFDLSPQSGPNRTLDQVAVTNPDFYRLPPRRHFVGDVRHRWRVMFLLLGSSVPAISTPESAARRTPRARSTGRYTAARCAGVAPPSAAEQRLPLLGRVS